MGDGPLRSLIEYAIQKRGIAGIEVLGFVDEATKTERMKSARWVVVPPNTKEDFGLTAVEARHLGVPCIITRDGGLPEAGGAQALICEPNNPEALARLLEQAAAMSETEYAARAQRTREELASELEPMEFYAREFRRLVRGGTGVPPVGTPGVSRGESTPRILPPGETPGGRTGKMPVLPPPR
jgi:glycosyltransferase involved in cell wall biosynthesis